jgi:hypothetical protein
MSKPHGPNQQTLSRQDQSLIYPSFVDPATDSKQGVWQVADVDADISSTDAMHRARMLV